MFFALSKLLDIFLSPLTWAILFCLSAMPQRKRYRAQRWAPAIAAALLYVFSIEPVSNRLVRALEVPAMTTARQDVTYDAVILLGGLVDDRATWTFGEPAYNDSVERMLVTYDLLRKDRAKVAILSGGAWDPAPGDVIEANLLADQLVAWGIARERLIVEGKSRNTHENAVAVAKIAHEHGFASLLMVTSAMHMPRARECFRAVSLDVDLQAVDYRSYDSAHFGASWLPRANALAQSSAVIREAFGRLVYRIRGYGV